MTTSSAYLFAEDLLDEGYLAIAARLREAGLDSATIAASYHHARDVFPHGRGRRVQYLEGGVCYFQPQRLLYGRIQPVVASVIGDSEPLRELAEQIPFSTWLVVLHNSRLAEAFPDCTPQTALGDRLLNSLCPAHPEVREFAVALAQDVARYQPRAIKLEAVHYMGFDHGGHHERSFVPLSPNVRFLLGMCFCSHCRGAAPDVDAERLQHTIVQHLERVFASADAETRETELEDEAMQELLRGYATARQRTVTTLVMEIAKAVGNASQVVYLDPSGATLGYATGKPTTGRTAVNIGWRDGIDLERIDRHVDGIGLLGYFADTDRFARELDAYVEVTSPDRLEVILRPMPPDTRSAIELRERVSLLRQLGVQEVSFYHYGFMRLENLDWVRAALQA